MKQLLIILGLIALGFTFILLMEEQPSKVKVEESIVSEPVVKTEVKKEPVVIKYEFQKVNQDFAALKNDKPELSSMSGDLAKTLGHGQIVDYTYRIKVLKNLHNNLSKSELREIFKYLSHNTTPKGDDVSEEAIRNDLLEVLINQNVMPLELGVFMLANFKDQNASFIWKDYLVQHFQPYLIRAYADKVPRQSVLSDWSDLPSMDQELALFIKAYEDIANETGVSYSGSALIGLNLLVNESDLVDESLVIRLCEKVLTDKSTNQLTKTSTLQILSDYNLESATKYATEILDATYHRDDALIASSINIYITGNELTEFDSRLLPYKQNPLFNQVINRNFIK